MLHGLERCDIYESLCVGSAQNCNGIIDNTDLQGSKGKKSKAIPVTGRWGP
jgi:hypothetical protein